MFYSISSCCPFVEHEAGVGSIPNTDLQGDAAGMMILDTDTSAAQNPSFARFAGLGGAISIRWQKNGFFVARSEGSSHFQTGNFLIHQIGTSDLTSATASGSVIGFSISSSQFSSMNRFHSLTMGIQRGP